jgi:oxygen-independent coproporphyrinogen-3 oxidase
VKELGLYIHIPFCKSKCHYCDFNSFPDKTHLIEPYFKALKKEISDYGRLLEGCRVSTLFVGGGTPSFVEAGYIYEMINECRQNLEIIPGVEISIEANPGTLSFEKLLQYRAAGINRLSLGLQAWQSNLLEELGRSHGRDEFVESFETARKAGFKNINVDLIFGLPGQTFDDWTLSVINTAELEPSHISCYSLNIEDGTVFAARLEEGMIAPADEELDRRMYWFAVERLEKSGFKHYEISNFARPGFECRHNLTYWKAEEYAGFGAGAHSYLQGMRYNNVCGVEEYISSIMEGKTPVENIRRIDARESMEEFVMLGFRMIDGVSINEFETRYNKNIFDLYGSRLDRLMKKQLVEIEGDRVRLTARGLDLANQVFMEFV